MSIINSCVVAHEVTSGIVCLGICRAVIISGSPGSVVTDMSLSCDRQLMELGLPVLGICFGMQVECSIHTNTHTHKNTHTHTHTHTHTLHTITVMCVVRAAVKQAAWRSGWKDREPV